MIERLYQLLIKPALRFLGRLWVFTVRYALIVFAGSTSWLMSTRLNRRLIIGRENLLLEPNTVWAGNHPTNIDAWIIGAVNWLTIALHPSLFPAFIANLRDYWERTEIIGAFMDRTGAIPVNLDDDGRDQSPTQTLRRIKRELPHRPVVVFPAGDRDTKGLIFPGVKPGAAVWMLKSRVVPFALVGMERIQDWRDDKGQGPATWFRRVLGEQGEFLLQFHTNQRYAIVIGQPITPAEIAVLVESATDNVGRAEIFAHYLTGRINALIRDGQTALNGTS